MASMSVERLKASSIPVATGWLLGECMEARGKQDLWFRQRPEVMASLREQAIIQSVESSNRIEGVTVPKERLAPVALGKARPRNRCEEELAGYRRALEWIFTRKADLPATPRLILHLHKLAQGGSGDAGQWKSRDNEIVEFLPSGEPVVRFRPTSAKQTPAAVGILCREYQKACDEAAIPPLLAVATFVLDFLCIHPFRDGNGRVSRLLTTFLLLQHGLHVARYVSLERLVEESKEEYYDILGECSHGWHESQNPVVPWWNYFLSVVRRAYGDLARQVQTAQSGPAKTELVRKAVLEQVGPFALGDISAQFPSVSVQLVKKVLGELKQTGQLRLTGRGRGARWEVR
ncbi:MAG: Adenosine monophosphate-protein transferase SoFic [Planctomycetes bacterium ADurb.Bin126]|nr:MAG: Adenosine monophosphate-protein transferase SoFic [Planctomycetes bacterium ADurb.Bin126]HOD83331.1 Fic family protein [Phycisphaerae bacterium]HQL73512.1 Fic family protein [Phycisphaerae bacterium]